jgi:flavodoxin
MRFSVFYFSGTGNTKWSVEMFGRCILKRNHECRLYTIEEPLSDIGKIIDESDCIGISYPVYGADMPIIMKRFINSLSNCGKPVFIITTAGYIDAFGPFAAGKLLKRNGLKLFSYINILMSNNISTPKLKANFQTQQNLKKRMASGMEKTEKLVEALLSRKKYIKNIGPYLIPGIFIRKFASKDT